VSDDRRDWYLAAKARIDADPGWLPGDIIAEWSRRFAPMAAGTEILPDAPGALFTVRVRADPSAGPEPDDSAPDLELGPTAGGFALRTRAGRVIHDRDAARRVVPSDADLMRRLLAKMPASRQPAAIGRGTDRLALARALAWWSLRHAGNSKAGAARLVIEWEGGTPDTVGGRPDKGHLRSMYQNAERTLASVGIR
jgi:hypothetical protein